MSVLAALLAAQLLVGSASTTLAAAEQAYAELRYDDAERDAKATLLDAAASDAERARAHRVLGSLAAIRNDARTAEEHFARMLVLDRSLAIDAGASPKIREPFEAALQRFPTSAPPRADEPPAEQPAPEETPAAAPTASPAPAATAASPAPATSTDEGDTSWMLWAGVGAVTAVVVAAAVTTGVVVALAARADPCAGQDYCVTPP